MHENFVFWSYTDNKVSERPGVDAILNRYITSSFFINVNYKFVSLLLLSLISPSLMIVPALAQGQSQVYGCQQYSADVVHCDLMVGEMQGYEVVAVPDGFAAANMSNAHPAVWALLLCDTM